MPMFHPIADVPPDPRSFLAGGAELPDAVARLVEGGVLLNEASAAFYSPTNPGRRHSLPAISLSVASVAISSAL